MVSDLQSQSDRGFSGVGIPRIEEAGSKHCAIDAVFSSLFDASCAQCLLATPPCMRDSFATKFLGKYDTKGALTGAAAKAELHFLARLVHVDISQLESLHATIRRLLTGRSVQTHRMDLRDLDAEWVASRCRSSTGFMERDRAQKQVSARRQRSRHRSRAERSAYACAPRQRAISANYVDRLEAFIGLGCRSGFVVRRAGQSGVRSPQSTRIYLPRIRRRQLPAMQRPWHLPTASEGLAV